MVWASISISFMGLAPLDTLLRRRLRMWMKSDAEITPARPGTTQHVSLSVSTRLALYSVSKSVSQSVSARSMRAAGAERGQLRMGRHKK